MYIFYSFRLPSLLSFFNFFKNYCFHSYHNNFIECTHKCLCIKINSSDNSTVRVKFLDTDYLWSTPSGLAISFHSELIMVNGSIEREYFMSLLNYLPNLLKLKCLGLQYLQWLLLSFFSRESA